MAEIFKTEETKLSEDKEITNPAQVYYSNIYKGLMDVHNALALDNSEYAYRMLQKLVFSLSDMKIYDECMKYVEWRNKELKLKQTGQGYTSADSWIRTQNIKQWENQQNLEFFWKIMRLIAESGIWDKFKGYGGVDVNKEATSL